MTYLIPFFTAAISIASFVSSSLVPDFSQVVRNEDDRHNLSSNVDYPGYNLAGFTVPIVDSDLHYPLQVISDGRLESSLLRLTGGHLAIDRALDVFAWCIYTMDWLLGSHEMQVSLDSNPVHDRQSSHSSEADKPADGHDANLIGEMTGRRPNGVSTSQSFVYLLNR